MKHFITLFLFLSILSNFVSAQITISGTVRDSANGEIVPFATVYYAVNDSTFAGTTADINGYFCLKINQTGTYKLISRFLYAKDSVIAILEKDTIINFTLKRSLEYDQPCRIVNIKNGKHLDLSTDKYDKKDYERIKIETRKIQLTYIPDLTDSFHARIWIELAFSYYGGYLYEFYLTEDSWSCEKINYSCNLFQFRDSIDLANPDLIDEIDDSTFYSLLTFKILDIEKLIPKNGWIAFENKHYFEKIFNAEDYCRTMLKGDRYLCLDGINYHIEIQIKNKYKFISFTNPECYSGQYKQVDIFLELIEYIENEFIPVE